MVVVTNCRVKNIIRISDDAGTLTVRTKSGEQLRLQFDWSHCAGAC